MPQEPHYFPLSPDQQETLAWASKAPAQMLNLCVSVEIESELDEALFRQALEIAVERLPYTRLRLHNQEDGTVVQYISEPGKQSLPEWKDCTQWTATKVDLAQKKWSATAFPNGQRDTQLFHAELMRMPDGKHILFFCGHHIIMDIYAVVYFITYLDHVYYALTSGTPLPRIGGSPEKECLSRAAYLQSEKYQRDEAWWRKEFSTEPLFTSINGPDGKEYVSGKRYGNDRNVLQMIAREKSFSIPREMEEAIKKMCVAMNISENTAYMLALRCYLAAVCKTDDVSIMTTLTNRATLDQKSCGLSMANGMLQRNVIPPETSFVEALRSTAVTNLNALKHSGIPTHNRFTKRMFGVPMANTYYTICLSYVPFADYDHIHLKVKVKKIDSGAAICPVYILLMRSGQGEELAMIYQYSMGYVKEKNVDRCHAFVMNFLKEGLKNPETTIGELMNLYI